MTVFHGKGRGAPGWMPQDSWHVMVAHAFPPCAHCGEGRLWLFLIRFHHGLSMELRRRWVCGCEDGEAGEAGESPAD